MKSLLPLEEKLADVFEERAVELALAGLPENAWLPFERQKMIQQRLRDKWLASEDGVRYDRISWRKTRDNDAYKLASERTTVTSTPPEKKKLSGRNGF
jgi:hypothetical protein